MQAPPIQELLQQLSGYDPNRPFVYGEFPLTGENHNFLVDNEISAFRVSINDDREVGQCCVDDISYGLTSVNRALILTGKPQIIPNANPDAVVRKVSTLYLDGVLPKDASPAAIEAALKKLYRQMTARLTVMKGSCTLSLELDDAAVAKPLIPLIKVKEAAAARLKGPILDVPNPGLQIGDRIRKESSHKHCSLRLIKDWIAKVNGILGGLLPEDLTRGIIQGNPEICPGFLRSCTTGTHLATVLTAYKVAQAGFMSAEFVEFVGNNSFADLEAGEAQVALDRIRFLVRKIVKTRPQNVLLGGKYLDAKKLDVLEKLSAAGVEGVAEKLNAALHYYQALNCDLNFAIHSGMQMEMGDFNSVGALVKYGVFGLKLSMHVGVHGVVSFDCGMSFGDRSTDKHRSKYIQYLLFALEMRAKKIGNW